METLRMSNTKQRKTKYTMRKGLAFAPLAVGLGFGFQTLAALLALDTQASAP